MAGLPRVSVIMAAYNVAGYIGAAIDSVLAQTCGDFELIVMDDGSSDGTPEIVTAISDARVRLIGGNHRGAPAQLARGHALAQAPYLAHLDADDLWDARKLERHVEFLDAHPEVDLTFSWSRIIDENGRDTGLTTRLWRGSISFAELLADNVIGNGSALVFRREALLAAGGFDHTFTVCYDLDAWLRIGLLRPENLYAIPEFLTFYRRRCGQLTGDVLEAERSFHQLIEKMRTLAPDKVASVERRARSNMQRFFAYGWYQAGDYGRSLRDLAQSLRRAPVTFLLDPRNWQMSAAALAGLLLPSRWHTYLRNAALRAKRA